MRYRTIVADPPWDYSRPNDSTYGTGVTPERGTTNAVPYPQMSLAEIAALPLKTLAERDAHLYLWTTQRYVERSFGLLRHWGFRPRALLVWCKAPRGWSPAGTFMNTTEFILFASRGSLRSTGRCNRQWWEWQRGRHSAKPEAFLDIVEQVSPGPYLELFARRQRLGWDTWGNEALCHVDIGTGA
jgi:N6-adenosine-specific RNA methylase IME4